MLKTTFRPNDYKEPTVNELDTPRLIKTYQRKSEQKQKQKRNETLISIVFLIVIWWLFTLGVAFNLGMAQGTKNQMEIDSR